MPKKVNWTSNLRVDVEDLEQGTHGYSGDLANEFNDKVIKDFYPRVSDGFRVEISDAANRVITVYSGVATDQTGLIITNGYSQTTSRSITLGGDATYFIEIAFSETYGDTDARAVWDPTFDNGLDTSGDVLPDGREFSQNIATRRTHDWAIVDPPSTSGFQLETVPGSTRVPLAVITVSGGAITAPTGAVIRTCFARTYDAGATSIRVLDSRLLPDTFTARLGSGTANQEDISVTANDRDNGILTLGAGTANAHDIGERVINQGGTQLFIAERVLMDDPTDAEADGGGIIASTAGDARLRLFQGDTEHGYALSQNPTADTGESDLQIKNLKEQVDYLASQMLELKYGAGSRDLLGTLAPPSDFTTTAHYSRSGGVVNARLATVSVGDGVSTWGDYNTTTSGSAQAALQAAVDALPSAGGIVHVKAGTYSIVNTAVAIVDKPIWLIGDSRDSTVIQATGTAPAIDFDTATVTQEWSSMFRMDNISVIINGGTFTHAMRCTSVARMLVKNCRIYGLLATGGNSIERSIFDHCRIRQSTSGTGSALQGRFNECTFNRCYIDMDAAVVGQRALLLETGSDKLVFNDCTFQTSTTAAAMVEIAADNDDIVFRNCEFATAAGVQALTFTATGGSNIVLENCKVLCTGGVGIFDGTDTVNIVRCSVAVPQDGSAVVFDNDSRDIIIDSCKFEQASTSSITTGVGVDLGDISGGKILNCHFIDCDIGMYLWSVNESTSFPHGLLVSGCHFTRVTPGRGRAAIFTGTNVAAPPATATLANIKVSDCNIFGLNDATVSELWGIHLNSTTSTTGNSISIHDCTISTLGDAASGNATVGGIVLKVNGSTTSPVFFTAAITGCYINGITAGTTALGVWVENVDRPVVSNCHIAGIGSSGTATTCHAIRGTYADDVVITNNVLDFVGAAGKAVTGGVIHLGDAAQTVQNTAIVISNNVITAAASSSNTIHGIYLEDNAKDVTVVGNTITECTNLGAGIFVGPDVNNDNVDLGNITIQGNAVRTSTYGALVQMDSPTAGDEGAISIVGNVFDDFSSTGIHVEGDSNTATACRGLSISGNMIRTSAAVGFETGIKVRHMNDCAIVGNSIYFIATGAVTDQSGIALITVDGANITGNFVRLSTTGANVRGIDLNVVAANVVNALIAANFVKITGDGTSSAIGVDGGDTGNYITSNSIETPGGLEVPRTGGTTASVSSTNDNREI